MYASVRDLSLDATEEATPGNGGLAWLVDVSGSIPLDHLEQRATDDEHDE
jgi:hypothetical protein